MLILIQFSCKLQLVCFCRAVNSYDLTLQQQQ